MRGFCFGLITLLADAVPEPVRVAASRTESHAGLYLAGVAGAAAVVISGVLLIRRRRRR
jgi:hypothetical protein